MFRTAAYYLVGAWVLLQVCDVVFPIIGTPDEALQLVLAATVAGFPVALIVGWKYDITPRGIKRTPSIEDAVDGPDLSLKRTDYVLLVTMAFSFPCCVGCDVVGPPNPITSFRLAQ